MKFSTAVSALLLSLGQSVSASLCTRGSLFLVDANTSVVNVWNLDKVDPFAETPFQITPYPQNDPADILHQSYTDNYVVLTNMGLEANNYTDGGVYFINAGVNPDIHSLGVEKSNPTMVQANIDCTRPIHYVKNNYQIAMFCDGYAPDGINSTIWVIDENRLAAADPSTAFVHTSTLQGSHHGVTVPIDQERVLFSVAVPERIAGDTSRRTALPNGFHVTDYDGAEVHGINEVSDTDRSCLGFHGSGHQENTFAFACNQDHGGILVLNYEQPGTYTTRSISYPDGYEGHRTGTLTDHKKNKFFVGNFNEEGSFHLVAFEPNQEGSVMSEANLVQLPVNQCSFRYERSAGELLLVWLRNGNLRVYTVNPWVLVAEVRVIDTMVDDCGSTQLMAGHGFAYITDVNTLYEIDLGDLNDITIEQKSLNFFAYRGIVAGVPNTYSCSGPSIPHEAEERSGEEGFIILHFEKHEPVPGSSEQTEFIHQLRGDLALHLDIGINRIFVMQFGRGFDTHEDHHDHEEGETDVIVELFFADPSSVDTNQATGEELKQALILMLEDESHPIRQGAASGAIEGTVTDEPPVPEESDDDKWPAGAIAGLVIGLVVALGAIVAAVVFRQREAKALKDLERANKLAQSNHKSEDGLVADDVEA